MSEYPIDIFEHRSVENVTVENKQKIVLTQGGEIFTAPALIIATGASWRKLKCPGKRVYRKRGRFLPALRRSFL